METWLTRLFTPYVNAMYEDALAKQLAGLSIGSSPPTVPRSQSHHRPSFSVPSIPTVSPTTSFSILANSATNEAGPSSSAGPHESVTSGCTAELNERLSQRHKMVLWVDKNVAPDENPTFPLWESKAIVDNEVVGVGHGGKIRIARNVASYRALMTLGLRHPSNS